MHVDWSVRALEAGKHVLCEKPLSRHPQDVERAFSAAEKAGRILMEAFMYRHNPQTKRLVEVVADGAIGRLRLVRAAFSFPLDDTSMSPPPSSSASRRTLDASTPSSRAAGSWTSVATASRARGCSL